MKGIGPIAEINCTIEMDSSQENKREEYKKATTKMTIGRKIIGISETRGIKEGIESIMETGVKMGI